MTDIFICEDCGSMDWDVGYDLTSTQNLNRWVEGGHVHEEWDSRENEDGEENGNIICHDCGSDSLLNISGLTSDQLEVLEETNADERFELVEAMLAGEDVQPWKGENCKNRSVQKCKNCSVKDCEGRIGK